MDFARLPSGKSGSYSLCWSGAESRNAVDKHTNVLLGEGLGLTVNCHHVRHADGIQVEHRDGRLSFNAEDGFLASVGQSLVVGAG